MCQQIAVKTGRPTPGATVRIQRPTRYGKMTRNRVRRDRDQHSVAATSRFKAGA